MSFTIPGTVWRDGTQITSFELTHGAQLETEREAHQLTSSYICGLVIQGGTATFSRVHDEYKIAMPDGTTEYVKWVKSS